jgi:hypothetical protein
LTEKAVKQFELAFTDILRDLKHDPSAPHVRHVVARRHTSVGVPHS